ncbi:hypothetical protein [Leisingera sp. HS039]
MIEDMRIRGMGGTAQKAHIRAIKDFAVFPGHPQILPRRRRFAPINCT